ncbi:MAG TPA: type III-A CRISPR-associated protein Cas10/Csm1 [Candidatus Macondimonas sp.]|nr:type III-A CRISPR-associated protein Cas10/Csm1 [Candidatus Macondimonas sp.]
MQPHELLEPACRVALAAYLHDLGKFAERARIEEAQQKDADGNSRAEIGKQLYCPQFDGRYTHVHAAYTAIAFDLLERHLPELVGADMAPFRPWSDRDADDSLINAAARHHKPDTFLQWIIATADRVASGFEREEFEAYNRAADDPNLRTNHYTARQLTLFEQVRLFDDERSRTQSHAWRYPLKALSPQTIFPVEAKACEPKNNDAAQAEYRALWREFSARLEDIPPAHRANLPLWLDHFDTLWQCYTQAIPAATAGNTKPEVSLYDHSRTTAALAAALWRFHHDRGDDPDATARALRQRSDWDEDKFLLVQGDFSGIQDFIFATGGETQKRAAKLLRGRSFYVSLLTECAALRVLEALGLPPTSQIINAAGRFLIVAPHSPAVLAALAEVQREFDAWFLQHSFGQTGIGLATLPASCNDFRHGSGDASPFKELMRRLFENQEEGKLRRLGLCGEAAPEPIFRNFLEAFDPDKRACAVDGRSPATEPLEGTTHYISLLAADQIAAGGWLASDDKERLLITRAPIGHGALRVPIFGYHAAFTGSEEASGRFGALARSGELRRAWDYSLPLDAAAPLWAGYARRAVNGYVPRFDEKSAQDDWRYGGIEDGDDERRPGAVKTLNHLACEDKRLNEHGKAVGVEALMTLKGDVDNLGLIFQRGLEHYSFAKMAALSRQMNAFFTVHLPALCRGRFPNTYTVFAGGDDFFLIGPWQQTLLLARQMRADFARYVAHNPELHFSAGLSMTKPGLPIRDLGNLAEETLEQAKAVGPKEQPAKCKNAVSAYGRAVPWARFEQLLAQAEALAAKTIELTLPTGYLYALLGYADMAGRVKERPENALWHSHFAYRTARLLERQRGMRSEQRRALHGELAQLIADQGIGRHGADYRIALFTLLYQRRD